MLSNKAAWVNAANAKNKVVAKINSLNVDGKIEELKKKIQLTRNKANLVSWTVLQKHVKIFYKSRWGVLNCKKV